MLKFIYTETALHLELVSVNWDDWIVQRQLFAARIGESILINTERATFLLPELICGVGAVESFLTSEGVKEVSAHRCDQDCLEVTLIGYWLCTDINSAEGVFITQLPDRVESYLWQLWNAGNSQCRAGDGAIG